MASNPYGLRPLVYLAGPYTKPDPCENTHNTIRMANHLHDEGSVTCYIPHLTHFWHTVTPRPYHEWLDYDIAMLKRCDAILRLPGASSGADDEVKYAIEHGIPVFHNVDDLLRWAE